MASSISQTERAITHATSPNLESQRLSQKNEFIYSKIGSSAHSHAHIPLTERVCLLNPNPPGTSWNLDNGPIKELILCDPDNAQSVLDTCKPYEKSSEQWKRIVAKKKEGPVPTEDALNQIFLSSFKSWDGYKGLFLKAVKEINAAFKQKGIYLSENLSHLRFYLTTGEQKAHAGHYTMDNSCFFISDAGGFYKLPIFFIAQIFSKKIHFEILKHITHEIFHLWSRQHPWQQEMMYEELGFYRCESLTLPDELSKCRYDNPDLPYDVCTPILAQDNRTILAVPLTVIDPEKCSYNGKFGRTKGEMPLPDYLELIWVELDSEANGRNIKLDSNGKYRTVSPLPDLSSTYGVDYTVHPEEILAELFVRWVWEEKFDWGTIGDEKYIACKKYFPLFTKYFC